MCVPTLSAVPTDVATPLPFRVTAVPRFPPSTLNCTVPVGVPPPLVTVAVNVTLCPNTDGFTDALTAVVVVAAFTPCAACPEVLVRKFPSPA